MNRSEPDPAPPREAAVAQEPAATGMTIRPRMAAPLLVALLAFTLPLLALVSPVNHDETQYLAGSYLVAGGLRPFADFAYLQTPYQAYAFAPVFAWFAGHTFLAARLLTGLIGAAILALLYIGQRGLGVSAARAATACALLWLCHSFLFGVTVVRNDALPALFLSMATLLAILPSPGGTGPGMARWAGAGLLMALSVGVKISYAAPLAAILLVPAYGAMLGAMDKREALRSTAALAIGAFAGLLPLALARQASPEGFDYGVFAYHAEAPFAWYRANGLAGKLTLAAKLGDVALVLLRGPALAALAIYGVSRLRSLRRHLPQARALLVLDALCLAGLLALLAPTPTWRQYAVPLLPPLFLGFGLVWQAIRDEGRPVPRAAKLALAVGALVGVGQPLFQAVSPWMTPVATPLVATREAHLLGRLAERDRLLGPVATLSPEIAIDSGLPLDPVFASGPFAYRSGDAIPPAQQAILMVTSPATVGDHLARTRPAVIVTGYENFDHVDATGLEQPLIGYARRHAYRPVASPYGDAVFWLRARGRD
jgi:hypothetical protein